MKDLRTSVDRLSQVISDGKMLEGFEKFYYNN